jgi:glycosyltransferase involved in cell wall biosynthesis
MADQRMRIIHVLHSKGYGGAENHALVMMKGQRARGHEVMFAGLKDSWLGRACDEAGIPVAQIRMAGLFDVLSHLKLRRLLKHWRADIVHGHLVRGSMYAGMAGHTTRKPYAISTAHATTAAKHMGRCGHIIAVSGAVRDNLLHNGYPSAKVSVIHNGMPDGPGSTDKSALRHELGIPQGAFAIVHTGRFLRDKGQDVLVQAMTTLKMLAPEAASTIHLYLIGDPATDFGSEVQALSQDGDHIHYLGYRKDVPRILPAFDAFVLPSRREAISLSVIEAFAARLPVVAARVGGVPEIVEHEHTGLLCPSEDAAAFAQAILRTKQQPAQAAQWAQAGRARYEQDLTADIMIDKTLACYARCLEACA